MRGTAVYESRILTAPGEEDTAGHAGPHGAARGMNSQGGGVEGRLRRIQRVQWPWFPWENVMDLLVFFHSW